MTTDEVRLELRVKNNVLWHAIFTAYASVADFCRATNVPQTAVGTFLNLTRSPYSLRRPTPESRVLTPLAERIAAALGMLGEDLFPPTLYETLETGPRVVELKAKHWIAAMASEHRLGLPPVQEDQIAQDEQRAALSRALETLTPREEKVIKMRFGLDGEEPMTLDAVGRVFAVGQERVRQIEAKALRKLRHPSRTRELRQYFTGSLVDLPAADEKADG